MTKKIKILLVEDDKIAQRIAFCILSKFDCSVDIADDGIQALQKVEKVQYDIIFTDIGLPHGLDGFEVAKGIRQINSYKTTPIFALTAHVKPEHKTTAMNLSMDELLTKPLSQEKVQAILEKHFPTNA